MEISAFVDDRNTRSEEYRQKMNSENRLFIEEISRVVVKSNPMIRDSKISLSIQEYKLMLYLISKVKQSDGDFDYNTYELSKLCKVLGIESSGSNYRTLRKTLEGLASRIFYVKEDGYYISCRWVDKLKWNPDIPTMLEIRLDNTLRPYLLNVKKNYTAYSLDCVISMQSRFSIRLYEYLRSYLHVGSNTMSIDDLMVLLDAKYDTFKDFRVRALDVAVEEINDITDLMVSYMLSKTGKKYTGITFSIRQKNAHENTGAVLRRLNIAEDDAEEAK